MARRSDGSNKKTPANEQRAGYESDFVEPPKEVQSECPVCLLILREPHITSCCGKSFCAVCIGRIEKDGKPCPWCSVAGFTTLANKGLKRTLHEFHVHCANRLRGCDWTGELGKLDEHLNYEPQPERQLEGCQFAVVACIHCKEGIRRDTVSDHQLEQCPQRPYTCEHCAEYMSTFEDVTSNHRAECKCFLLPCPNNCTLYLSGIERQDLDHHVKVECPLTVVQCELHHAGCKVSLPRKDMADHMREDSVMHISLLATENLRLQAQVTSQSKELEQSKAKISSQSQDLDKMRAELQVAQQQAIDQLQAQQQQQHYLRELSMHVEMQSKIVPVIIKMAGFEDLKRKGIEWYSRPFYTCIGGYRMCLSVYANGNGDGEHTHVSVFTYLMRGEFDSQLKWPFCGEVTIQLLNQLEDKEHHELSYSYDSATGCCAAQITGKKRSDFGWGKPQFISYTELGLNQAKNRHYLKDDCLVFRVVSIK